MLNPFRVGLGSLSWYADSEQKINHQPMTGFDSDRKLLSFFR